MRVTVAALVLHAMVARADPSPPLHGSHAFVQVDGAFGWRSLLDDGTMGASFDLRAGGTRGWFEGGLVAALFVGKTRVGLSATEVSLGGICGGHVGDAHFGIGMTFGELAVDRVTTPAAVGFFLGDAFLHAQYDLRLADHVVVAVVVVAHWTDVGWGFDSGLGFRFF